MPAMSDISVLVLASLVGYLIGSIPLATLISRRRNVDIFTAGSGLPGAANVYRSVGAFQGMLVFWGDSAKGLLAMAAAYQMGLGGELVFVPAMATLMGHWRPVFTHFRGGDGVSTLVGITVAVFPVWGLAGVFAGLTAAGAARLTGRHGALWGGFTGYGCLLLGAPKTEENMTMLLGVVALALAVLAHGLVGHYRRAASV